MIKQTLAFVAAFGIGVSAFAAGERGNGADVVVCNQAYPIMDNQSSMLLDLYEGKTLWEITNYIPVDAQDWKLVTKALINRVGHVDPYRGALYTRFFTEFEASNLIDDNLHLPDLPDDGAVRMPGADCDLVQAAYQQDPERPGDVRYYIKKEVWDALDTLNKGALVFHELAYHELLDELDGQGHETNSRGVRYYNANVANADAQWNDYYKWLEMMKIPVDSSVDNRSRKIYDTRYTYKQMEFNPETLQVVRARIYPFSDRVEFKTKFQNLVYFPDGSDDQEKFWVDFDAEGFPSKLSKLFSNRSSHNALLIGENCPVRARHGGTAVFDPHFDSEIEFNHDLSIKRAKLKVDPGYGDLYIPDCYTGNGTITLLGDGWYQLELE